MNTSHNIGLAVHEDLVSYFQDRSTLYRLVNSARACLAAALCVCVSNILQIPLAFESVVSVIVLFSVYPGLVFGKGTERVLGRLVGILLALGVSAIFYEVQLLYIVAMALMIFWGLYRSLEQKTPYASIHAALSVGIMMSVATAMPLQVTDFAYHWWFQVLLGVAFSMLIALVIPLPTGPALDAGIAGLLANSSSALESIALAFQKRRNTEPESHGLHVAEFTDLMKLMEFEKTRDEQGQGRAESYRRLLVHAKVIYVKMKSLEGKVSTVPVSFSDVEVAPLPSAVMQGLSRSLKSLVDFFTGKSEIVPDAEVRPLLDELTGKLDAVRREPPSSAEEHEMRKEFAGLVATLKDISDQINRIRGLAAQTRGAADPTTSTEFQIPQAAASLPTGFNPESAKRAFRATASTIALILGLIYMDLPGGPQVVIAALIVGAQANLGKSMMKWRLRLLGVTVGAAYGFAAILIVSFVPHFVVMLVLLLLGIFIGSYVATGDDRYSYAGLQMAIVVPLVLVYEAGPPAGMTEALSRFLGALIGGLAAVVMGHLLWPDDPIKHLREHLGAMLGKCSERFRVTMGLESPTDESGTPLADLASTGIVRSAELIADARRTLYSSGLGLDSYARITHILGEVISDLTILGRVSSKLKTRPGLQDFIADVSKGLKDISSEFDRISIRLTSASRRTPLPEGGSVGDEFRVAVERYRATGKGFAHDSDTAETLVLIYETIERLCEHLNDIDDALKVIETFGQGSTEPRHG